MTRGRTLALALTAWATLGAQTADDGSNLIGESGLEKWRKPASGWLGAGTVGLDEADAKKLASKPGSGILVNGKDGRAANLLSSEEFGDVEAHVEFLVAKGSNSGVYFLGRYEIQVLDSWGKKDVHYSDCGGIYQRWDPKRGKGNEGYEGHAPRVNASKAPGEWQSLDVVFRAPRFDAEGKKTASARFVKVVLNGQVIHEDVEAHGPTRAGIAEDEKARGPLMLQGDHGPVAYRNLRVRKTDDSDLTKAVTFYASFDSAVQADFGGGELTLSTRSNHKTEKGAFVVEKGFSEKAFRIAPDRGISGGALEAVDVLPDNGRIFFPAKGNIAFKKGGWGATLSMWINHDPDTQLKTRFCDPVQITHKGAGNGGLWFDFNDAKPNRNLRMGAFPAVPDGTPSIKESREAFSPMVWVDKPGLKVGEWHHVALVWRNLDTGKNDGHAALHIDGKLIGEIKEKDYPLSMDWDLDKAGIYIAINYIGLIDEFALFNRPLSGSEIEVLRTKPGLLSTLKRK